MPAGSRHGIWMKGPWSAVTGGTCRRTFPARMAVPDCVVDMQDLLEIISDWLKCTDPSDRACDIYWL